MEIPPGDNVPLGILRVRDKDQRIVDRGVCLSLKHGAAMREGVAHRTVNLWNTSQRVGVLYAAAIAVRLADLAAFEHVPQVRGGFHLSAMRTRFMNTLIKC